jgi:hypothetical protein
MAMATLHFGSVISAQYEHRGYARATSLQCFMWTAEA